MKNELIKKFQNAQGINELLPLLKEHLKLQTDAAKWTFVPTQETHRLHYGFSVSTTKLKRKIQLTDVYLPSEIIDHKETQNDL